MSSQVSSETPPQATVNCDGPKDQHLYPSFFQEQDVFPQAVITLTLEVFENDLTFEETPAAPAPAPSSPLHWEGETQSLAVPWLVKNLLPATGAGLLSGQWGTGKTFAAIHLAGCAMTGENFVDYRVKRPGGVLFIAKEGKAALPLRLAVMKEHSLKLKDNVRLPFAWADIPVNLVQDGAIALIQVAQEMAKQLQLRFNVPLVLIIIDTVPAAAGYKDESAGAEGTWVMNTLHALSEATGAFVLGVEHFGKTIEAGTRGTMTKEDRSDAVLALIGERTVAGKVSNLRLGLRKVRDGESGREIPFRLERIDCGTDEDGDHITSHIVHWEPGRPVQPATPRQTRSNAHFVNAMTAAMDAHGNPRLFTGVVAVPEAEVRKAFMTSYMANGDVDQDAAGERWRKARNRAIATEAVELRRANEVRYLCWPEDRARL